MNRYGNEVGFHNPELTANIKAKLEKALPELEFIDASWHNDLVDTLAIEKLNMRILIPNNEKITDEEQELWATFNFDGIEDFWDETKECNDIEEAIQFIKTRMD